MHVSYRFDSGPGLDGSYAPTMSILTNLGSVAFVTGGAGGIGGAICTRLAQLGLKVAVADLSASAAEAKAAELPGDGHMGIAVDVADFAAVAAAVAQVNESLGDIDVLVNVAGWDRFIQFIDTDPDFWDRIIDINYRGVLNTTRHIVPGMVERRQGRVISIASDAARVGSSLEAVYSGAKGAVVSFSKSLAREVAKAGVTVNVVCPGPTATPLFDDLTEDLGNPNFGTALAKAIPMRRMGEPDDVAPAVAFLASEEARFITGQTLSVSGGLTMS